MARIIVNIAGGQTQPNILFAKEIHQLHGAVDQMVVLHTDFSEPQYRRTEAACADMDANFLPIAVPEDDIVVIQTKLSQLLIIEDEDEILVNITGGTKMMAIAVYDYFQKFSARIFYVTFGKNTYTQVLPRIKNKVSKFTYALSLEEYLTGYGVSIVNGKKLHSLSKPIEITNHLYDQAIRFSPTDWEYLDYIRVGYEEPEGKGLRGKRIVRGEGKDATEIKLREETFSFLERIGFQPDTQDVLSKKETKYLTGDWFEEYIYHQLAHTLALDQSEWGLGVQIKLQVDDAQEVPNELDLAIMLRNTLHVIECKTRMITTGGFNILTDTLYKTDSLRSKFGLRVPVFLFTLADESEVAKGIPRSKLNDITIVNRDQIQDPEMLKKLFKI